MKDENIKKQWTDFINDDKYKHYFISNEEYWQNKLILVKKYIDENNKKPTIGDTNIIIKQLGEWLSRQRQVYIKKDGIMKYENIRKYWEDFTIEYKQYFISNEDIWINHLENVKKYIDKNKKRPSSCNKNIAIKKLGVWILTNRKNYLNKDLIMKDENIRTQWDKFINIYKIYIFTNNEEWQYNLNLVKKYIDENNKRPSCSNKNIDIKKLGQWIIKTQENYVNITYIMTDETIYKLWTDFINDDKYKYYLLSNDDIWINHLKNVKKYIDENNKRPSKSDKNIIIKQLGKWISHTQGNYANNKNIMKDETIYKLWSDFINDDKYKQYFISNEDEWQNKLILVKQYIDENNKKPTTGDTNIIIKQLGVWLSGQRTNYIKKDDIMKDENIRKCWEDFTIEYKQYFISNEDIWINHLENVKKYIDENNKIPTKSDKHIIIKQLGRWISGQRKNYLKKQQIMKDENIRKCWEDFINDDKYKHYFI